MVYGIYTVFLDCRIEIMGRKNVEVLEYSVPCQLTFAVLLDIGGNNVVVSVTFPQRVGQLLSDLPEGAR